MVDDSSGKSTLNDVISQVKKEIIQRKSEEKENLSSIESPKILSKTKLTDKSLINDIDDYDKNEWVNLRTSYANKLFWLLAVEIIALFAIIIFIGLEKLKLSDTTLNVTIIAVLMQTFLLVKEIVTNLFKRDSTKQPPAKRRVG